MRERSLGCAGCGGRFRATAAHAVAHCSAACRAAHAAEMGATASRLEAAGFGRSAEVPNVYTKDGYAITVEEARRDFDRALDRHARWLSRRG